MSEEFREPSNEDNLYEELTEEDTPVQEDSEEEQPTEEQPTEEQPTVEGAEDDQEETQQYYSAEELKQLSDNNRYIDVHKVPKELQGFYKALQADYTRKTQELAEMRRQAEPVGGLSHEELLKRNRPVDAINKITEELEELDDELEEARFEFDIEKAKSVKAKIKALRKKQNDIGSKLNVLRDGLKDISGREDEILTAINQTGVDITPEQVQQLLYTNPELGLKLITAVDKLVSPGKNKQITKNPNKVLSSNSISSPSGKKQTKREADYNVALSKAKEGKIDWEDVIGLKLGI